MAFALSGLIAAARKRLDAAGVCVVAGLAAFGGGTLRDVLLDRRPFFWVEHATWLWALLALCIAVMIFMRGRHFAPTERAMRWPDAMGLGLFTAGGTQAAMQAGMPAIVVVLMGIVNRHESKLLEPLLDSVGPRAQRPTRAASPAAGQAACRQGL